MPAEEVKEDYGSHGRGVNKRILRVDQVWSRKDRQLHLIKSANPTNKPNRFSKYVLIVRRIIDSKGALNEVKIDIKSLKLASALVRVFKDADGLALTGDEPMLDSRVFFHAYEGLKREMDEERKKPMVDTDFVEDLSAALDFIVEEFASTTTTLKATLPHGDIVYDHLWAIFSPACVLFSQDNVLREMQAYRFSSSRYQIGNRQSEGFIIEARMIHRNGEYLNWGTHTFLIPVFDGSRKVVSLPIYPISYHPDHDNIRQMLVGRGRDFLALHRKPICKQYRDLAARSSGDPIEGQARRAREMIHTRPAEFEQREPTNYSGERLFDGSGRIIVDPAAFIRHNANSILLKSYTTKRIDESQLTDDELALCDHRTLGFSFHVKEWGAFAISHMSDVGWNDTAFSRVILDDKKRRLISTLVESHRNDDTGFDDIVKGKGKGLVGLLTGGPGVGKTLTAEAVAEMTQRPLYVVSAGELGTEITSADRNLSMALETARRWGSVLLIDEADVFLQTRDVGHLVRNALVSLFLRRLEYFEGIMILTTNRSEEIDDAFQSRIHFKFNYPTLETDSRLKLWKDFLNHLPKGLTTQDWKDEDLETLADYTLNGREVKNAVSCASSIALFNKEPLTPTLMMDILESLFDDRLKNSATSE
ncbi:P-loop containing nucleoside triphosphate hydrolase protein [Xylariaceae sp. FL1019]|nr:P-loop containing nucleoside triphosphate hydrolase protein [Xylariaceae sp. FL1019]